MTRACHTLDSFFNALGYDSTHAQPGNTITKKECENWVKKIWAKKNIILDDKSEKEQTQVLLFRIRQHRPLLQSSEEKGGGIS